MKLDLGCGKNRKGADWIGVDSRPFEGVDTVCDLTKPWPWADGSVDEIHASHVVEHFKPAERIHFANEAYRVLKTGGQLTIIVPHVFSERAYGDLSHEWPPVTGFWFYYLDPEWRKVNAPHNDFYTCDFEATWGYSLRPDLSVRNIEYQQMAIANFKEACQDMIATLKKRVR